MIGRIWQLRVEHMSGGCNASLNGVTRRFAVLVG